MRNYLFHTAVAACLAGGICLGDTFSARFDFMEDVPITAPAFSAVGHALDLSLNFAPETGVNFTVLNNTGRAFIEGNFTNLIQGQTVELVHAGVPYRFVANYHGGSGNDLVLQWAATRLVGWGDNSYGQLGNGGSYQSGVGDGSDHELPTPVSLSSALAGKTVTAVAAGVAHSLALRSDGRVIAWGGGNYGALGDGTTTSRLEPVAVEVSGQLAGRTVIAVDAGYSFSVALASDGKVFTWGYNGRGQLGNGTTSGVTNYPLPVAVDSNGILAGRTVVAVAAGYSHVLALCADGTLAAWGDNSFGQFGNGNTTSSNVPVAVNVAGLLAGKSVVAIAAGNYHCLALCSDGTLAAWGANDSGSLGNGTMGSSTLPVAVDRSGVLAGRDIVFIGAGASHSLAVCKDGLIASWGFNGSGRLGDGTSSDSSVPVAVDRSGVLVGKSVIRASASAQNSIAYCADGTIASWGSPSDGRLGFGADSNSYQPGTVSTASLLPGERFLMASTGQSAAHSFAVVAIPPAARITVGQPTGILALAASGNSTSNLGHVLPGGQVSATFTLRNSGIVPLRITGISLEGRDAADFSITSLPATTLEAEMSSTFQVTFSASAGFDRQATLRIASNDPFVPDFRVDVSATVRGSVDAAWSSSAEVPLSVAGFDPTGSIIRFTLSHAPVTGASLVVVNQLGTEPTVGNFENLTQGQRVDLVHDGVVYRFFANYQGGDGNDFVLQWADTRLVSWGDNNASQLGDGGTVGRALPKQVNLASEIAGKQIVGTSAGGLYSHLLTSDGTLVGWGGNYSGEVGTANTSGYQPVPSPVDSSGVLSGSKVVSVVAGQNHTLALCADGTLAAWGENDHGQLGAGFNLLRSFTPTAVVLSGTLTGKRVVAVKAGQSHTLALCSDGTMTAWGSNWHGVLGNDGDRDRHVPVAVCNTGALAGKRVTAVAAGGFHSLALCSDGTIVAWGDNSEGQLGDNSRISRRVPTAVNHSGVLAGKAVTAVAAGLHHSLALCSDGTVVAWGKNSSAQLGVSDSANQLVPVEVIPAGELAGRTVIGIAAFRTGSVARCSDGNLLTWGYSVSGALGTGVTNLLKSSLPLKASLSAMAAGTRFAGNSNSSQAEHLLGFAALAPDPALRAEAPDRRVLTNGVDTVDFSAGMLTGEAPNRTFTLRNLRGGPLTISSVTFEGANPADFVLSRPPLGAIAAGAIITFQVAFSPTDAGLRQAVMKIFSNDPLASPFTVQLTGTAEAGTVLNAAFADGGDIAMNTHGFSAVGKAVHLSLDYAPPVGTCLTVVENTGPDFIRGAFENLAHGQEISLTHGGATYDFAANYHGGTGNDLILEPARGRLLAWGSNTAGGLGNGSVSQSLLPTAVDQRGVLRDKTIFAVATGGSHSLALCSDGTLAAWGNNTIGQLGNGTLTSSPLPVPVDAKGVLAGRRVVAIAAGASFSLALCEDGVVAAWGINVNGQLGNGDWTNSSVPVRVSDSGVLTGKSVIAISAGSLHSLALCSDGTVASWGQNGNGRLGDGTWTDSNIPVAVIRNGALAGKRVIALAAGQGHSLALCADGTAVAWGLNTDGQFGTGGVTNSYTPVSINTAGVLDGKIIVALAAGGSHSLACCRDGTLVAWGSNSHGQIGTGGLVSDWVPSVVGATGALIGKNVIAVAAGLRHSSARCSDGSLVSWGDNASGQLGDNSTIQSKLPVAADMRLTVLGGRFVTGGSFQASTHNLAIVAEPPAPRIVMEHPAGSELVSGRMMIDFGISPTSQTAGRTVTIRNTGSLDLGPFSITFSGPNAEEFSVISPPASTVPAGGSTTMEIGFTPMDLGARSVMLKVGSNDPLASAVEISLGGSGSGELSVSFDSPTQTPVRFEKIITTGSTIALALNYAPAPAETLTAIRLTGPNQITGFFDNLAQGQPVSLPYGGRNYRFIANYFGGNGNQLVLLPEASRVQGWGHNSYGQLGIGSYSQKTSPVAVSATGSLAGRTIVAAAAGERHSLALCADGGLVSWGDNASGQLGRGNSSPSNVPVEVTTTGALAGKKFVRIAAGQNHSVALCLDGTVVTWGLGSSGQLGNGSYSVARSPVVVNSKGALAGKTVIAVSAGGAHNLALCSDGTLAAWGSNSSGQLGIGTTISSPLPTAVVRTGVLAGKSIVAIAAGVGHSLALCSDGSIAAWGENKYGAIGDNTTTFRSLPVLVNTNGILSGRVVTAIAAGKDLSLALCGDGTLAAWGDGNYGKLGDGSSGIRTTPVAVIRSGVLAARTVMKITACADHCIVTCSDGTSAAWGQNTYGQLGAGNTGSSFVPVLISTTMLTQGGGFLAAFGGPAANHSLAVYVANLPPDLTGCTFSSSWQASLTLSFPLLLANATDPDGDLMSFLNAGATSLHGGTITVNGTSITYSPTEGFTGEDSFAVTVVDSRGASTTGTVRIFVGSRQGGGNGTGGGNQQCLLTFGPTGTVTVTGPGMPGHLHEIQRSVDLLKWKAVATAPTDSNNRVSYTDESAPSGAVFYRIAMP